MKLPRKEREIIDRYSVYVADPRIVPAPFVSVLMWTYNDAPYIRQSIDSVLMQKTGFDYELVISDDCSTDGTTEILREYQRNHPQRIRLILSRKNLWHFNVITQRLLEQGIGTYIALTHGDDYWTDPCKLQKQVDTLASRLDAGGVFHDTLNLEGETGEFSPLRFYAYVHDIHECSVQDTIRSSVLCHTSSFMCRNFSNLRFLKWNKHCWSGDMAIFFLAACQGKLVRMPEFMSVYRTHSSGITASGLHSGRTLHYHRLRMLLLFRRHLGARARELDWQALNDHVDAIVGHQGIKNQWTNFLCAAFQKPLLFFHPRLFPRFLKAAATRVV